MVCDFPSTCAWCYTRVCWVKEVLICLMFGCACFLRLDVFIVYRFLAQYMGGVMGRFGRLTFTALLLGRSSTQE